MRRVSSDFYTSRAIRRFVAHASGGERHQWRGKHKSKMVDAAMHVTASVATDTFLHSGSTAKTAIARNIRKRVHSARLKLFTHPYAHSPKIRSVLEYCGLLVLRLFFDSREHLDHRMLFL